MADKTRSGDGQGLDGGAYIGNRAELAEETIPGGVTEDDERVAGHDSRSSGDDAHAYRLFSFT